MRPVSRRVTIPHVDALDGLRGAAVAGVLLFHGGHLTGGYLGVDLFFVLSGFLITTLLLAEGQDREAINLGGFWARRARRLLPALAGLLVGVALYCVFIAEPAELSQIRGDALATLFYFANWHAISTGQNYWALFTAPVAARAHVEPRDRGAVLRGVAAGVRRPARLVEAQDARRRCSSSPLLGAVVSTALMVVLYDPTSPNRVYFGTDTRATGILLGAALAAIARDPRAGAVPRPRRVGLEVAGWRRRRRPRARVDPPRRTVRPTSTGAGSSSAASRRSLVIAAIMHPQRMALGTALGFRPLCWLGIISYGLYLWHWPVDVVLDADRTGISGWPLFAVQTAVAIAIAVVSYRYLERPIRRGALTPRQWYVVTPVLAAALVVVILVSTITPSGAPTLAKVDDPRVERGHQRARPEHRSRAPRRRLGRRDDGQRSPQCRARRGRRGVPGLQGRSRNPARGPRRREHQGLPVGDGVARPAASRTSPRSRCSRRVRSSSGTSSRTARTPTSSPELPSGRATGRARSSRPSTC